MKRNFDAHVSDCQGNSNNCGVLAEVCSLNFKYVNRIRISLLQSPVPILGPGVGLLGGDALAFVSWSEYRGSNSNKAYQICQYD